MPWYAVASLDDAFDATKALLVPIDAGQWLRLALVAFFLGGAGSTPSATAGGSTAGPAVSAPGPTGGAVQLPFSPETALSIAVAVLMVVLTLAVLYALVGSVMEFVFVETLRRRRVRVRRYADQHLERALRLFGFRIALGALVVVPTSGVVVAALSALGGEPRVSLALLAVSVPLVVLFGAVVAAVDVCTTHFVVPVMIGHNVGVLAGWRRFWPTLAGEWKQYGVYALVRVGLALAAGTVASIVAGVVGAVLFAPLALAAQVVAPAVGNPAALLADPLALAVGLALAGGYLLAVAAAMALVLVPVQTYLRYHALFVLGDTDAELDLVPNLRRELRS